MLRGFFARFLKPDWTRLAGAPAEGTRVCRLSELGDGRPKYVEIGSRDFLCFVILRDSQVRAFRADCPHKDRPMGSSGVEALYGQGEIACQHHGAFFSVDSGLCKSGPCKGARLCPVDVHCQDDWVLVGRGS